MKIATLIFNPIQENTYLVWDETMECAIIDAGNNGPRENEVLKRFIADHQLKPVLAVNTHGHFDHTLGVEFLKEEYKIPFALSGKDQFLLETASVSGMVFGVQIGKLPSIDLDLDTVEEVRFGQTTLKVITGDTLFRESIGRTDLPGGDYSWIMRSILEQILPLGDEVTIWPGHGEKSTIGHESMYNPFVVEVLNNEVKY